MILGTRAGAIARTDLRRRLRNRSAIVTAFAGPVAMAAVFGTLIGGTSGATFTLGVVDAAGTPTSKRIVAGLLAAEPQQGGKQVVRFRRVAGEAAARAQVKDGDLDAALVVPSAGGIVVLRSPDRLVGGQVGESVAQAVAAQADRAVLSVRALSGLAGAPSPSAIAAAALAAPPALALADTARGGSEASTVAYYGAGMAILFLFFTVGFAARSVIAERESGTLGRVLASPTRPGEVIAGKTAAVSVLGMASFVVVWLVTSLAFGADWGPALPVLLVMAATVFAVGGVATFVCGLARTESQAEAYTSMVTFAFALLGGNFVGPGAASDALQSLSLLTPNGWALHAFTALSAGDWSRPELLLTLAVLAAFGLVFGALGVARVRKAMPA